MLSYAEAMLREINRAIYELVTAGAKSATISMGGGTQSYTRLDLDSLESMRRRFAEEVAAQKRGGSARRVWPDFGGGAR